MVNIFLKELVCKMYVLISVCRTVLILLCVLTAVLSSELSTLLTFVSCDHCTKQTYINFVQETGDGQSDSSLETESFLRATESVVTAMQARMSFSLDSGGESDVDTSHSYQAPSCSTAGGGGMPYNLLCLIINGNFCWLMPSDMVFAHPGLCYLTVMVMIVLNVGDIGNLWTS